MITVKNLHKRFGDNHVLRGINYEIDKGEKIVIIGPSGSGKSTFLRCLNLLEVPTEGEIWLDNDCVTDPKVNIDKLRQRFMNIKCICISFADDEVQNLCICKSIYINSVQHIKNYYLI